MYLEDAQRKELEAITKRGKQPATTIRRANILLRLDESQERVDTQEVIAKHLRTSTGTIYKVSRQFVEEGLQATVYRKKRETPPTRPIVTGEIEARIIALACSEPPEGRLRWTLRLLEEKVVKLQIVEAISDNTIGRLLKKHHLSLI